MKCCFLTAVLKPEASGRGLCDLSSIPDLTKTVRSQCDRVESYGPESISACPTERCLIVSLSFNTSHCSITTSFASPIIREGAPRMCIGGCPACCNPQTIKDQSGIELTSHVDVDVAGRLTVPSYAHTILFHYLHY